MTDGPALVIGASGQDGSYIVRTLLDRGIAVHATGRALASQIPGNWTRLNIGARVQRHSLDPSDAAAVDALVATARPSQIFCLSGQSSVGRSFACPDETIASHVLPLRHVAAAVIAHRVSAHIVYAGSGDAFGETSAAVPATENSAFAPLSPYADGKVQAIQIARQYGQSGDVRISVAHLFGHESPLRPTSFLFGKLCKAIATVRAGNGAAITLGRGDIVRDWGWAPDYAAAMVAMAACDEPQELVLATGVPMVLRDAVSALFSAAGLVMQDHVQFDDPALIRSGEAASMVADPARARAAIGWTGSTPFPVLAERLLNTVTN